MLANCVAWDLDASMIPKRVSEVGTLGTAVSRIMYHLLGLYLHNRGLHMLSAYFVWARDSLRPDGLAAPSRCQTPHVIHAKRIFLLSGQSSGPECARMLAYTRAHKKHALVAETACHRASRVFRGGVVSVDTAHTCGHTAP